MAIKHIIACLVYPVPCLLDCIVTLLLVTLTTCMVTFHLSAWLFGYPISCLPDWYPTYCLTYCLITVLLLCLTVWLSYLSIPWLSGYTYYLSACLSGYPTYSLPYCLVTMLLVTADCLLKPTTCLPDCLVTLLLLCQTVWLPDYSSAWLSGYPFSCLPDYMVILLLISLTV
jgi:hypothetical protein